MITQQSNQSNASPYAPRAFINVIFFDEQFKAVDFKTSMVGSNSTLKDHYADLQNLVANKSGFVYIYCSNESPVNVFFDNVQVVQTRSPILEETHYYPFGLTMAGISSKAANIIFNKEKTFQGQQFDDDLGLGYVEFKYRNHDPQIGRFMEIDPLSEKYVHNSTYAFSENKVTAHVELEGLESVGINDIENPYVKAFLSNNVTRSLSKMADNVSGAGSIKVGLVSGGIGFRGKLGKAEITWGASGPQVSTTLTLGGDISAEGSVATLGTKAKFGKAKVGSGVTFGLVKYEDGKITSALVSSGADGSISSDKSGANKEISSSGDIGFGSTFGNVSLDANANPQKAAQAGVGFLESLSNFIKAVVKEVTPKPWGGNKEVPH